METLFQSTQAVVFLSIAAASFVFVCIGFLIGGGHDHDGDFGHDAGDHGHETEGAHEYSSVSFFSPKVLAIFCLAFGSGGYIASILGLNGFLSSVIGVVCGFLVGGSSLWVLRLLYRQQANSLVLNGAIVGSKGQVTTRIPQNGLGEVTFVAGGQSITQLARSTNNTELAVGKAVKIVTVAGDALLVELA